MKKEGLFVNLSILLTLVFFGVASFFQIKTIWGFNHLHYLSNQWWIVYLFSFVAAICLLLFSGFREKINKFILFLDQAIFNSGNWKGIILMAFFAVLFFLLRSGIHLLGDGYTWLSTFGKGESFIPKWTERGGIEIVRMMQNVMGGYTRETAQSSFMILSILSGVIYVYNMVSIIKQLFTSPNVRVLAFATFIFSGIIILFMGYIEFYPMALASGSVFINMCIRSLDERKFLWWITLSFLVAALLHVMSLFYIFGFCFVAFYPYFAKLKRSALLFILGGLGLVGIIVFAYLYNTKTEFNILILPLLNGRPPAPDYTVFSLIHIRDILNELLLVFPGVAILLTLLFSIRPRIKWNMTSAFLAFLSAGPMMFLLLYGAAITMGLDWDIMALSLLAPFLFVLYQLERPKKMISSNTILIYMVVVMLCTSTFVAVVNSEEASEKRYYSLLNHRNRSGWAVLAEYYKDKGDISASTKIIKEMDKLFPEYTTLKEAYNYLYSGNIDRAYQMAQALIGKNPNDPNFLRLMGNVYMRGGKYKEAEEKLRQAQKISPYSWDVLDDIGKLYLYLQQYELAVQYLKSAYKLSAAVPYVTEDLAWAYIQLLHYDSASALANSLLATDTSSASAHRIKLIIAVNKGNPETARYHYEKFIEYGKGRLDYNAILNEYAYLFDSLKQVK